MDKFKQFILSFSDLSLGIHDYEFDLGDWFFENFEYSEIKIAKIKVKLTLEKEERMIILNFSINGKAEMTCDRCGDPYQQPLEGTQTLIVKIGSQKMVEDDDVVVLNEHDQHLDITQYLYENVSLLLPMHRIHPVDSKGKSKCNKDTLNLLDNLNPLNKTVSETTDPRWEELKKLKFK